MCTECHVVSVNVEIRDLQALKNACQRLGWTFLADQTTYRWYGRWVDDSPIPEHLFSPEDAEKIKSWDRSLRQSFMAGFLGHGQHAIAVPGCQYEVGLKDYGDHFKLVWDFWEPALRDALGSEGGPLLQAYAVELEKLQAALLGYSCTETVTDTGHIQLTLTSYED